jgi:hypothetical protein
VREMALEAVEYQIARDKMSVKSKR